MGFWPVVLNVLKNSDVVLLLIDARMPEVTRNAEIIRRVENMRGKRLIFVFNKCDLIGRERFEKLKEKHQNSFFISGKDKSGTKELKNYLVNLSENWNRPSLRVGIVGYPNVGKSTLINLLAPKARAKISDISGTTKETLWIRNGRLRIMDSPGVIPFSDKKIRVGMSASKDPHRIKNPEKIAMHIMDFLDKESPLTLNKFYNVDKNLSGYDLFTAIGKKKGYLLRGGEIDENRTAIRILEDWGKGKIALK